MRVLLIGGTGVLSTAVTHEAVTRGFSVTMINRGRNVSQIPKEVELIKSDKDNIGYIAEKLFGREFDAVIDFLCYNQQELERSFKLYSNYTKQYFFISSAAVYNTSVQGPCKEDHPKVQAIWEYSVNKWSSEKKLMRLSEEIGVNYTIVRPMITYDDTRIPYGIAPYYGFHWTFVERILHNKPIILWNNGLNRCNMMRVEDFAVGLVGLIGNKQAYNEAFNICGDETPSYREVMDIVGRQVNHLVKYIDVSPEFYAQEDPGHKGELLGGRAVDFIVDNSKLKGVVADFSQTIRIEDGVRMTLDAYRKKHYEKGISWIYDADCDRIILKWCKQNHLNVKQYNLGFVDYWGTATFKDKVMYFLRYKSDKFYVRIFTKILAKLRRFL